MSLEATIGKTVFRVKRGPCQFLIEWTDGSVTQVAVTSDAGLLVQTFITKTEIVTLQ